MIVRVECADGAKSSNKYNKKGKNQAQKSAGTRKPTYYQRRRDSYLQIVDEDKDKGLTVSSTSTNKTSTNKTSTNKIKNQGKNRPQEMTDAATGGTGTRSTLHQGRANSTTADLHIQDEGVDKELTISSASTNAANTTNATNTANNEPNNTLSRLRANKLYSIYEQELYEYMMGSGVNSQCDLDAIYPMFAGAQTGASVILDNTDTEEDKGNITTASDETVSAILQLSASKMAAASEPMENHLPHNYMLEDEDMQRLIDECSNNVKLSSNEVNTFLAQNNVTETVSNNYVARRNGDSITIIETDENNTVQGSIIVTSNPIGGYIVTKMDGEGNVLSINASTREYTAVDSSSYDSYDDDDDDMPTSAKEAEAKPAANTGTDQFLNGIMTTITIGTTYDCFDESTIDEINALVASYYKDSTNQVTIGQDYQAVEQKYQVFDTTTQDDLRSAYYTKDYETTLRIVNAAISEHITTTTAPAIGNPGDTITGAEFDNGNVGQLPPPPNQDSDPPVRPIGSAYINPFTGRYIERPDDNTGNPNGTSYPGYGSNSTGGGSGSTHDSEWHGPYVPGSGGNSQGWHGPYVPGSGDNGQGPFTPDSGYSQYPINGGYMTGGAAPTITDSDGKVEAGSTLAHVEAGGTAGFVEAGGTAGFMPEGTLPGAASAFKENATLVSTADGIKGTLFSCAGKTLAVADGLKEDAQAKLAATLEAKQLASNPAAPEGNAVPPEEKVQDQQAGAPDGNKVDPTLLALGQDPTIQPEVTNPLNTELETEGVYTEFALEQGTGLETGELYTELALEQGTEFKVEGFDSLFNDTEFKTEGSDIDLAFLGPETTTEFAPGEFDALGQEVVSGAAPIQQFDIDLALLEQEAIPLDADAMVPVNEDMVATVSALGTGVALAAAETATALKEAADATASDSAEGVIVATETNGEEGTQVDNIMQHAGEYIAMFMGEHLGWDLSKLGQGDTTWLAAYTKGLESGDGTTDETGASAHPVSLLSITGSREDHQDANESAAAIIASGIPQGTVTSETLAMGAITGLQFAEMMSFEDGDGDDSSSSNDNSAAGSGSSSSSGDGGSTAAV